MSLFSIINNVAMSTSTTYLAIALMACKAISILFVAGGILWLLSEPNYYFRWVWDDRKENAEKNRLLMEKVLLHGVIPLMAGAIFIWIFDFIIAIIKIGVIQECTLELLSASVFFLSFAAVNAVYSLGCFVKKRKTFTVSAFGRLTRMNISRKRRME